MDAPAPSPTNTLLVALDLSAATHRILREVRRLAETRAMRVVLLHAAPPDPDFVGYEAGPQSVRDQIAEHFRDEHARIQDEAGALREAGIDARGLLVQGPAARCVLDEAEALDADWIVLGSHGHGAVRTLLMGSTVEQVLKHADRPVLVVPARDAGDR